MFLAEAIKKDFPIFKHNPGLVYLDSSATSLKPQAVLDAERVYNEVCTANVHSGLYDIAVQATDLYEGAREKVRQFINAASTKEIIFTRNATESSNLVANTFGQRLGKSDAILITEAEHHANFLPWQKIRDERGCELRYLPILDDGNLDLAALPAMLTPNVKIVAVALMSNVLGIVNDVKTIIDKAHANGSVVLIDGAQAVPDMPVDVRALDADFLVFSGHKMLAPTGIGVLYGKEAILNDLPPFLRGGHMILEVSKEGATWNELPWKFEAGTPSIAAAIGFGAAIDYLQKIGMDNVWQHMSDLAAYAIPKLQAIPGLKVLGGALPPPPTPSRNKSGTGSQAGGEEKLPPPLQGGGRGGSARGAIFAFTIDGYHPHDIGTILAERGVAVRAGHHCAMPLHRRFGLPATTRASCHVYNTTADIDALIAGLEHVREVMA